MTNVLRGEVYWVDLNSGQGSEINKVRPCVVMSADPLNRARRTVIIVPLSSSPTPHPPITIPVSFQEKNAVAVIDQIRAIDKTRLKQRAGVLPSKHVIELEEALRQVLALSQ